MFRIRAVREQRQHTLIAICSEGVKIEELPVRWGRVDLEITGVNNRAGRSFDGKRKGVHNRMRDMKELHAEAGDGDLLLILDHAELGFLQQPMLFKFVFYESHREARAVDRNVQIGKDERQRADMIFVSVREKDRLNFALVLQ